jgi:UDP-N-acetylglucosamine acyltransferase
VGVHQFVTVGGGSFVGGHSKITQDVPCYMRVEGNPPIVRGINGRALKAKGWSVESLAALREAHRLIFVVRMNLGQAATLLDDQDLLTPGVLTVLKFLESQQAGRLGRARWPQKER